ncbi:MAG: BMC domain-containing protein [Coriobacteriia bacterium]|nr:BMC domain-containing protein [Coriobacteriia bacterium]
MKKALGLIETRGLTASITAADAAVKSANVVLLGREYTRGAGLTSIKIEGDVGAVKAAVDAGAQAASAVGEVVSAHVIPRPNDGIDNICVYNERMVGGTSQMEKPKEKKDKVKKKTKKSSNKKKKSKNSKK